MPCACSVPPHECRRFDEYTEYPSYEAYLDAYTLTPDMLMNTPSPLWPSSPAQDDPVIPYADFEGLRLINNGLYSFEAPKYGRHCSFIEQLDDARLR